jgi:hypothetical protein
LKYPFILSVDICGYKFFASLGDTFVSVPAATETGEEKNEIPILETEVEVEFLQTLISIYLGPMRKGVNGKFAGCEVGGDGWKFGPLLPGFKCSCWCSNKYD